jgi:hypothetical protein
MLPNAIICFTLLTIVQPRTYRLDWGHEIYRMPSGGSRKVSTPSRGFREGVRASVRANDQMIALRGHTDPHEGTDALPAPSGSPPEVTLTLSDLTMAPEGIW